MLRTRSSSLVLRNKEHFPVKHYRRFHPPRATHVLCIPLVTPATRPTLEASLNRFRETGTSLLAEAARRAAAEGDATRSACASALLAIFESKVSSFIDNLHVTICSMSLKAGNGRTHTVGSNAAGICVTDSAVEERTLDDAVNLLAKLDVTAILREVQDLPASAASKQPSRLKIDLTGLSAAPPGYKHFHAGLSDASGCLPAFHQKLFNAFDQDGLSRYSEPPRLRVTILDTFRLRVKLLVKGHEAADESLLRTLQTNRSNGAVTNASQIASNITKREHENVTLAAEQDKLDYTSTSNSSSGRHLWGNGIVRSILRPLIAHMADFQWGRNLEVNRIVICKSDPRSVYDAEGNLVDMVLDEVAVRSLDGD